MEESKGGSLQEGASSVVKIPDGDKTLRDEDPKSQKPKSSSESVGNGMTIKQ